LQEVEKKKVERPKQFKMTRGDSSSEEIIDASRYDMIEQLVASR